MVQAAQISLRKRRTISIIGLKVIPRGKLKKNLFCGRDDYMRWSVLERVAFGGLHLRGRKWHLVGVQDWSPP